MSTPLTLSASNLSYRLPDGVSASSTRPLVDKIKYSLDPNNKKWSGKVSIIANTFMSIIVIIFTTQNKAHKNDPPIRARPLPMPRRCYAT